VLIFVNDARPIYEPSKPRPTEACCDASSRYEVGQCRSVSSVGGGKSAAWPSHGSVGWGRFGFAAPVFDLGGRRNIHHP